MLEKLKALAFRGLAQLPFHGLVAVVGGRYVPVFMLHRFGVSEDGISRHSVELVESYLKYIHKHSYVPVALDELFRAVRGEVELPSKAVVFTIDDGFYDQGDIGIPLFLKYDCPVTCFLITGFLDGELWPWDDQVHYIMYRTGVRRPEISIMGGRFILSAMSERYLIRAELRRLRAWMKTLSTTELNVTLVELAEKLEVSIPQPPPEQYRPMSWSTARQLEARGARFSAHTVTHKILSRLNDEQAAYEIQKSTARVREELASASRVFCFPTGRSEDFGLRECDILAENGYVGAVATTSGTCAEFSHRTSNFVIASRFSLPDSRTDFLQYLSWVERAKELLRNK